MTSHGSPRRIAVRASAVLSLVLAGGAAVVAQERSPERERRPAAAEAVSLAALKGEWMAALSGVTGCGVSTVRIDFTLESDGTGTQSFNLGHTAACGDNTTTGLPVEVQVLNPDGSGHIGFSCGDNCGFVFAMQVSRNKQMLNLVAESAAGNYLAGTAVRK